MREIVMDNRRKRWKGEESNSDKEKTKGGRRQQRYGDGRKRGRTVHAKREIREMLQWKIKGRDRRKRLAIEKKM